MGPLHGKKVVEIASIGPEPFCAMMLSDLGAEVVHVDRKSVFGDGSKFNVLNRERRSVGVDLKNSGGVRPAPAPAPRFSRTPTARPEPRPRRGRIRIKSLQHGDLEKRKS